jgi:hypothetical protein
MQNTASPQAATFNISGDGTADTLQGNTAIVTPSLRALTDSTTALQVQNAAGTVDVITVDTVNDRVGIGTDSPDATLSVEGSTADSSSIALDVTNSAGGSLITARNDGQVTIGATAASGTSTTFGSMAHTTPDGGGDSNYFTASKFTTGSNPGALTSISIYVNSIDPTAANDKFRLAIYADNGSLYPTTLVAQSSEGTLSPNTFNTLPVTASLSANTTYWLAYQTNGTSVYNDFSYASGASNQYYSYSSPYGTFPGTAGTGGANGALAQAIYGTYTEAGTSTTPAVVVASNGNVGIGGVTAPSTALQVQGTVAASALSLTGNGSATAFQAGLFDTASGTTLNVGTSNATSVNIGNSALISTVTISNGSTGGTFINYASTLNPAASLGNFASSGAIGTAATTVDIHTSFTISQTTSSVSLTIPSPTNTTAGRIIYIANTGSATVTVGGITMSAGASASYFWNGSSWVSTAVSTGVSIIGTYSSSSIANGASISGNTLTLGVADGTNPGMVSTTTQTIAGNKTLTGNTTMTGTATVANTSTTAFQIQNTGGGTTLLTADTSGNAVTINGALTASTVTTTGLTNNGQTTYGTLALGNFSSGGSIGSAATTVDIYTSISVAQTSGSQTLTIPNPTASTAYGKILYLSNVGTQGFTLLGTLLKPGATATLVWSNTNGGASWQYAGSDGNSILNQSSSTQTGDFKISGTGTASTFTASTLSAPNSLSIQAGSGNSDVNILAAGTGTVKLETGSAGGSITLGSSNLTRTISIGSTGSQAQTITVGDNTSASGSTTTIQGSDGVTLQTNKSTAGVTVKSATNSATAFQIQNATNTNLVNVDTVGGNVNLGVGTPPSPLGYTKVGGNTGSAYNNTINANQFTATQTGAVSTMSVYVSSPDSSPTNHFQVAVYTNSGGVPSTYVASSASTTLTSGWNTVSLTSAPTLNAGTTYWFVYWADVNDGSNSGMSSDSGVTGSVYYFATSTYGSGASNGMPTTFPSGTNAGTIAHSIYATFASTSYAATISGSGSLSVTGAATFTDNSNSTTAFQIQNSSGTSVLTADTINNRISIGTIGTSTSQLYVAGTVPTLVGTNSDSNMTDPRNMTVVGHYAYVIDRSANKIDAYNLVTGTPVYVGKNSDANLSTPFAVAGAGHYVYVVNNVSNKLTSYDISSGTPVYVGQNSDSNLSNPQSVAISGRYAYVTSYTTHKVVAYDISSGTPVYVGQNSDSNLTGPSYIATGTGYVYVVDSSTNKLLAYNISTGIPVYAGTNSDSTISTPEALTVNGNYAYIPNDGASNKLLVYDITTSTPTFVAQNSDSNLSTPYDVAISGRYAYVLSKANNKLVAYDISSGTPVYIGSNSDSTLSSPIAVSLYGSYIFVTSNTTHKLVSYSLGGAYLQQLQTGSADLGSLSVDGNTTMMGNATVQGGVSIGQSLQVNGSTGIQGALGVGGTITSNALSVGSTGQFVVDSSGNFTTTGGTTTVKTTSTTALSVQNASNVSYFNVDTSTGTITIGSAASGNYITFTAAGGLIASGTAQHAKTISLSAEYAGAVLDATQDGTCTSNNNGAMTSAYDGTNNYYKWVSNATAQCYDVVVRVPIPSDWSSWSSTTPITVNAYTTNTSTSLVNLQVLNSASNTAEASCSYANITPGSTSTWSSANSSNCVFASTTTGYAAGGTMTLRIRMTGGASSDVRIDGITLNYNSKF